MKRTDNYPTRLHSQGKFIKRKEPVAYERPLFFSHNQWQSYLSNGFLIIKDFFDHKEIASCLLASDSVNGFITNEPKLKAIRAKTGIHEQQPFKSVIENEKLLMITRSLVGSPIYIHQSRINYKAGLGANGWYWHSDFETWHAQDGMPSMRCVSAMIPLTDNTMCNGSLMLVPGSHKMFYSCKKETQVSAEENFADQKEGVPDEKALKKFLKNDPVMAIAKPGDLILFDCNTIHVSNPNMTNSARTNLFAVYNSIENKLQRPFSTNKHRPESMGTTKINKVL